jgi:hypothetical protein
MGVVIVDYRMLSMQKGKIDIRSSDNKLVAKFTSDSIFLGEDHYSLGNINVEEFKKRVKCFAFYPDYHILVLEGKRNTMGKMEINIDDKCVFIESKYVTYQTISEHLKYKAIDITGNVQLKKKKDDKSETIKNFQEYSYIVKEVQGDWLKVKCDEEVYGLNFEGYVKWIKNEEITVTVLYSY